MKKHHARHSAPAMPVSMPVIHLDVHHDGTMTATVNGEPLAAPPAEKVWRRASFAQIVDQVTGERMIPARIEVTEVDGSTFTDIITASPKKPAPPSDLPPEPIVADPAPDLAEVTGDGFVPGEDIAVCVILAHTDATHEGTARTLLEPSHLPEGAGEVVLFGRASGTVCVRSLP